MNLHDVIRGLIRGYANTESNQQRMLLAVDAAEKGYPDLETYQAELDAQAKAQARQNQLDAGAEQTPAEDAKDVEIARLRAALAAQESAGAPAQHAPDKAAPAPEPAQA